MKNTDNISGQMHIKSIMEHVGRTKRKLGHTGMRTIGFAAGRRTVFLGIAIGLVLGAGIMFVAAGQAVSKYKAKIIEQSEYQDSAITALEEERDTLSEQNGKLMAQADKEETARSSAEKLAGDTDDWALVLINEEHPLDSAYVPQLAAVDAERSVDVRILEDLQQMMSDGAAQGLNMYVTSAYRSYERQKEVFNAGMQNRLNSGMTPLDAYEDTKTAIALPGTSEHASGLAVDIIASGYSELDERQADTPEQQWLMAHCWEYGFILRYPKDRSDITGIIYEPWHYRYVGKEAAKEITEQGLTLEEYMGDK